MGKGKRKVKSTKISLSFPSRCLLKEKKSAFLQMDDIFQSYRFRTWEQVWICLMSLNPNCLYRFRAVPFASLLQGGVYLFSQQLIEESCFLASPFFKAKDPANGLWDAEGKALSSSWWLQRNSRNWRNFMLVQQQQDFHALQWDYHWGLKF